MKKFGLEEVQTMSEYRTYIVAKEMNEKEKWAWENLPSLVKRESWYLYPKPIRS